MFMFYESDGNARIGGSGGGGGRRRRSSFQYPL
jgi:hypothetical protein